MLIGLRRITRTQPVVDWPVGAEPDMRAPLRNRRSQRENGGAPGPAPANRGRRIAVRIRRRTLGATKFVVNVLERGKSFVWREVPPVHFRYARLWRTARPSGGTIVAAVTIAARGTC
ncbi:hypothetical protein GCM10023108_37100 [Saccharopolyspora hordei]